jgi:TPR repeat protein
MKLENAEAMFFIGVCCELGMGVNVNHELAKECYSLGSQYGSINAKQAIERINQNGFWPATDQTRQNFRNALKMQIEIQGNAAMMNRNFNNSNQSNSTKDYGACPNCHGTGRCTMCAGRGEWKDNNGIYHDCSICHGGGQCPSCHGSGKLR